MTRPSANCGARKGSSMAPTGRYIYGIIAPVNPVRFDIRGIDDAPVYTITHQELAAVVSDREPVELDPTRRNVLAHTRVQDALLSDYTVLPTGFGMMAQDDDKVREMLARNQAIFVQELRRLNGKIEMALTLFWNQEAMLKEMESQRGELSELRARIASASSPDKSQGLLIEAGRKVEHAVSNWKARYAASVYGVLKELAWDAHQNQSLGIRNILNAAFLIDRSAEKKFKEAICRLDAEYRGKIDFKSVGPLPPYDFVDIRLEPVK